MFLNHVRKVSLGGPNKQQQKNYIKRHVRVNIDLKKKKM